MPLEFALSKHATRSIITVAQLHQRNERLFEAQQGLLRHLAGLPWCQRRGHTCGTCIAMVLRSFEPRRLPRSRVVVVDGSALLAFGGNLEPLLRKLENSHLTTHFCFAFVTTAFERGPTHTHTLARTPGCPSSCAQTGRQPCQRLIGCTMIVSLPGPHCPSTLLRAQLQLQ